MLPNFNRMLFLSTGGAEAKDGLQGMQPIEGNE